MMGLRAIAAVLLVAALPVEDSRLVSWTEERVRAWQPLPEERIIDQIGWAKDIREARRLAQEHHRPIFLFTHTGRINTGRC